MNAWKTYTQDTIQQVMDFSQGYIDFLSYAKTERLAASRMEEMAIQAGYIDIEEVIEKKITLKPQDKVYIKYMNKSLCLMHIGNEPLEKGLNILGAHIDSPRLDLKQHPLYEDSNIAYFDTHYYGGVKKYQWVTIPLAIHGVICLKNGETISLSIGEEESDPVFVISDLLIHLSSQQMEKTAAKVVEGETLNVTVGSIPLKGEETNAIKANILKIIKEKYGFEEDDFISAELEVVPSGKARSCGLDSSFVLGYGHDDRVCAYTSLIAQLEAKELERSAVCLLVDKEEVGSQGATGMQSRFFETFLAEVMNSLGIYNELALKRTLQNSSMLSSDVCAAHDPNYADVSSPNDNMPTFASGMALNKYTGARGKSGSNDANAEYIAQLRNEMDSEGVISQTGELGKVDAGGGGTIAYILANYGMRVIDCGVPLHNMHAPYELANKADIYETYKGYKAFLKRMK